jgi:hypothetical protein
MAVRSSSIAFGFCPENRPSESLVLRVHSINGSIAVPLGSPGEALEFD